MIHLTNRETTGSPDGFFADGRRRMEHGDERQGRRDEDFGTGGARVGAAGPRLQPPPPLSYALIDTPPAA